MDKDRFISKRIRNIFRYQKKLPPQPVKQADSNLITTGAGEVKKVVYTMMRGGILGDIDRATDRFNQLLKGLHPDTPEISTKDLMLMLIQNNVVLVLAMIDGQIVGMGSLYIVNLLSRTKACIEDVIVDNLWCGYGIGTGINRRLIEIARREGADYIELTSNSDRKIAHRLYEGLGFERRSTNVFRLDLSEIESEA